MKKGISNGYFCEYCSRSFSAKIHLLGHITNHHKKCDVCQNIFQSGKVLGVHNRSVHKKAQLKNTIERETSFKNIRTRNKLRKWLNIKCQIEILVKLQHNLRKPFKLNKELKGNLRWDSVYLLIHWS